MNFGVSSVKGQGGVVQLRDGNAAYTRRYDQVVFDRRQGAIIRLSGNVKVGNIAGKTSRGNSGTSDV